jgi:hypothetical protein
LIFVKTDDQPQNAPTISLFEVVVGRVMAWDFLGQKILPGKKNKKSFDNFPSTTFVSISKHLSEQEIPTNQRLMMRRPSYKNVILPMSTSPPVQTSTTIFGPVYKNKFKNLILTSKFKFLFQG